MTDENQQNNQPDYEIEEIEYTDPIEKIFNLPPGSTPTVYDQPKEIDIVQHETYDEKDSEIERQFEEIYVAAMQAFDAQLTDSAVIEPKFKARSQEVAVQFLNAALNAAKEKSTLKLTKDKINIDKAKGTGPRTLNQNLIVADRNEILKTLRGDTGQDDGDE